MTIGNGTALAQSSEGNMQRLTDKRTAEQVRQNLAGLKAKGMQVSRLDEIYVKLADYENEEERREQTSVNYDPDDWYE